MSYILEALKKSDQERRRGATPNLQVVLTSEEKEPIRRPVWPYLLLAAMLLNAGLLLWWSNAWRSDKPALVPEQTAVKQLESTEKPSVPAAPETPKGPPASTSGLSGTTRSEPQNMPAPSLTASESVITASPETRSPEPKKNYPDRRNRMRNLTRAKSAQTTLPSSKVMSDPTRLSAVKQESVRHGARPEPEKEVASEPSGTPKKSPDVTEITPAPDAAPQTAAATRNTVEQSARVEAQPKILETAVSEAPKAAETAPPDAPAEHLTSLPSYPPALESAIASNQRVQGLKDLPPSIRQAIPRMTFSVLIYSNKPAERMININGRATREGQEVSEGLKLEEITQDGAILNFKGYRFRKGVF
ncbi:MAG: general secretion pathway protein GspB [Syntrophobacteraceae bacterium]